MKKTLLKIGFIIFCFGVIIFLLLPFLETTAPTTADLKAGQAQVATDNPLNVIAKRLASLFGRKERARKISPGTHNTTLSSPEMQEYISYAPSSSLTHAATNPAAPGQLSTETIDLPSDVPSFDYANASFQTDNGEWVLVQQKAPKHSAPGMHEINVHDNPYDRYIRQERAKNFGPQAPKQDIPPSKWARLVHPLQTFFGLDTPYAVPSVSLRARSGDNRRSSSERSHSKSGNEEMNSFSYQNGRWPYPGISPYQWAMMTPEEREEYQERQAVKDFNELLSGDRVVEDTVEVLADVKFPNPINPQQQEEKEKYVKKLIEETKQQIKDKLMDDIEVNAEGKEDTDELADMTGCKDSSLPPPTCEINPQPNQHEPADVLAQESEQNAEFFLEKTKFLLPQNLPVTVVLGPTQSLDFKYTRDPDMAEKYRFLAQQQQCNSRTCYWLPNQSQPDPKLGDTMTTVGKAKLRTDPLNVYETNKDLFVQYKVQQLGPDATPEQIEEAQREANEQWETNRTNWVPYYEDQIVQLDQNKDMIFLVPDVADAPGVAKLLGHPNFVYTEEPLTGSDSPVEQGRRITNSTADLVNTRKQIVHETLRPLREQMVSGSLGGGKPGKK